MKFIGVDLAWSNNNKTGLASIKGNKKEGKLERVELGSTDEDIVNFVEEESGKEPALVAVDAPLLVPNEEGRRLAEEVTGKFFRKYDAGAHPANRKRLSQWTGRVRGEDIANKLEEKGFKHDPYVEKHEETRKVIEVYPHPSMVALFDLDRILRYKNKPGRDYEFLWKEFSRYQSFLKALEDASPSLKLPSEVKDKEMDGVIGKALKEYEDKLDAVFCAYIAYYYWSHPENCRVLGNMEEGYIMTPVKEGMKREIDLIDSQKKLEEF